MMEIHGKWFYKAPGTKCIDLMPAFFEHRLSGPCEIALNIFAPPSSGENDPTQGRDWQTNYYTTLPKLPTVRLRFAPTMEAKPEHFRGK